MRPGSSCAATARCRPTPSASSCSACSALPTPERDRAVGLDLHRAAARPSTARTWPRTCAAGAIYLPLEDLRALRLRRARTSRPRTPSAPLRALLAFEVARARALLATGAPLIGAAARARRGSPSPAFIAGGRAALDAIERAGYDVLAGAAARRRACARALARARARRLRGERGARAMREQRRRELADAYSHCEAVTRAQAAQLLLRHPPAAARRRRAMCAVYAFARRVDDIGDGTLAPSEKLRLLDGRARGAGARLGRRRTRGGDPVMVALADAQRALPAARRRARRADRGRAHGRRRAQLRELRGARRSTAAASRARSAGCAWRSSACASRRAPTARSAERLADDLGVALQLTNILRDVREDAENGRVYLPGEDLRRFGAARGRAAPSSAPAAALRRRASAAERAGGGAAADVGAARRARALRGASARASGSTAASRWRRCSTGAAPRACWRWPASTGGCSSASRPTRASRSRGACRCRRARRRGSPRAACCGARRVSAARAPRVLVVGGGLAGHHRGARLRRRRARSVTLVEVRRRLGGAAYSFERDGLRLDNGQHVFLRCCTAYRALLARLGSEQLRVGPAAPGDPGAAAPGAAPYAAAPRLAAGARCTSRGALARYPHLTPPQRARRGARGARADAPGPRATPRARPRDASARGSRATARAREAVAALWDLIALPTLNLPAAGVAGARRVRLPDRAARRRRRRRHRLSRAHAQRDDRRARPRARSRAAGRRGAARLARRARSSAGGGRLRACTARGAAGAADGAALSADAVDRRASRTRAPAALLEPLLGERAARCAGSAARRSSTCTSSMTGRCCEQPFAAGVGTPVQYLFDRTAAAGAPAGCQYLAVSLSGAEREMAMSVDALRERYLPALRAAAPARARRPASRASSSPASTPPRSAPPPASARCARARTTAAAGLVLAGAGPPPAGRRRSRAPC